MSEPDVADYSPEVRTIISSPQDVHYRTACCRRQLVYELDPLSASSSFSFYPLFDDQSLHSISSHYVTNKVQLSFSDGY